MLRVFIGYDPRQPIAFNVCAHSVMRHASVPVSITALHLKQLPITRRSLTEFTFSRFLVPWLCNYEGAAVFMDADIIMRGDIKGLFDCFNDKFDCQVMQYQARFEWSSVVLFNNAKCKILTPEFVQDESNQLLNLSWAKEVGCFPRKYNFCVGYEQSKEFSSQADLLHFTKGIPVWNETRGLPEDEHWYKEAKTALSTCSYQELMGASVHAQKAS
jgi:lipopolysaccharide biosynthesis glycosyltransferase